MAAEPSETVADAEIVFSVTNGVATIRLNRPAKYNGWRETETEVIRCHLSHCAQEPSIKAVILTGTGAYYTAGADISSSLQLTRPSTMRAHISAYNQGVFDMLIDFPKPILTAVNGPAVGVGVTSATLTDLVLASPTATFHTPFANLGLPPEGCSSFNFPRLFGEENARTLLHDAVKVDAQTALRMGLVREIVEPDHLLARAQEVAEELASRGSPRPIVELGLVEKLKAVNVAESIAFAAALTDRRFFEAQSQLAQRQGKTSLAWLWWTMSKVVPLVSRL